MSDLDDVPDANRLRPHGWPPISVEVRVPEHQLADMIARVEANFAGASATDPKLAARLEHNYKAAFITDRDRAFFIGGRGAVRHLMAAIARSGVPKAGLDTCFELGCGVGRATVWLAEQFRQVIAADISAPHLAATQANLEKFGRHNVSFVQTNRLGVFEQLPRFDVLYSMANLQHDPPPLMRHILGALLMKLNSGGVGYFQIPTYGLDYAFDAESYLATPIVRTRPEHHFFPQAELHALIEECGCRLLELREDGTLGGNVISCRVLVQKR
jgi:SAM-dependent methyltransferase